MCNSPTIVFATVCVSGSLRCPHECAVGIRLDSEFASFLYHQLWFTGGRGKFFQFLDFTRQCCPFSHEQKHVRHDNVTDKSVLRQPLKHVTSVPIYDHRFLFLSSKYTDTGWSLEVHQSLLVNVLKCTCDQLSAHVTCHQHLCEKNHEYWSVFTCRIKRKLQHVWRKVNDFGIYKNE